MDIRPGDQVAEQLAALRRVAVLVAGGAAPEEVFAAVAAEAGRLLGADLTTVARYDPGGVVTILGGWSSTGTVKPGSVGTRTRLGGQNTSMLVFRTGRAVRIDDYKRATGAAADVKRDWGFRAAVGAPITVDGRLWGVMSVGSTREAPLPADTEARLADFTELAGSAIANAQARLELRRYADEQAALRRVATLVARATPPQEVFAVVTEEIGRVFSADFTRMSRYDADGMATTVGEWTRADTTSSAGTVGHRMSLGGRNVTTLVFQTGQPARIDDYADSSGVIADAARAQGFRSAAGVPIRVAGRLWGVIALGSASEASPLPTDTEVRLAAFTELAGTAIANADAQAALTASRARLVAAADETRRRIERDLHEGPQRRLISLARWLREVRATVPSGADELAQRLDDVTDGLDAALEDLRETARGIHPAVLTEGGLGPALDALARRCTVPVNLHVQVADRPPYPVEIAAYYVVSEALTNTAKHARSTVADVDVIAGEGILRVRVRDDGRGGADSGHGSGLVGLKDRVEALGGRMTLDSKPGVGTTLEVDLPLAGSPVRG